jgi:hypothetical protein
MLLTPHCGPKIEAILKAGISWVVSRPISAAELIGNPLGPQAKPVTY